jgi:hypothetical protein
VFSGKLTSVSVSLLPGIFTPRRPTTYADFRGENATFLHSEGVHRVRVLPLALGFSPRMPCSTASATTSRYRIRSISSDRPHVAASHSFDHIIVVAGIVPFIGILLVLLLVRNTEATEQGLVRPI